MTPAVIPDETIARQIKDGAGDPIFYDPDRLSYPLAPEVFRPSPKDGSGLSMIRLRFRASQWAAHRPSEPHSRFRLAGIPAERVSTIGVAVGLDPFPFLQDPDELDALHGPPWGHVLLPAVNRAQYDADKQAKERMQSWARKLASSIGPEEISEVISPPTEGVDPYRPSA